MASKSTFRSVPVAVADCETPKDFHEIAQGTWKTLEEFKEHLFKVFRRDHRFHLKLLWDWRRPDLRIPDVYWDADQQPTLLQEIAKHNNYMYARFYHPSQESVGIKSEFEGTKDDPVQLEDGTNDCHSLVSLDSHSPSENAYTFMGSPLATDPDIPNQPPISLSPRSRKSFGATRNTISAGEPSAPGNHPSPRASGVRLDHISEDESDQRKRNPAAELHGKRQKAEYGNWSIVKITYKGLPKSALQHHTGREFTLSNAMTIGYLQSNAQKEVNKLFPQNGGTRQALGSGEIKVWVGSDEKTLAAAMPDRCLGDYVTQGQVSGDRLPRLFMQLEVTSDRTKSIERVRLGAEMASHPSPSQDIFQASSGPSGEATQFTQKKKKQLSIPEVLRGERQKDPSEPWWLIGRSKEVLSGNGKRKNAVVAWIRTNRTMRIYSHLCDESGNRLQAKPKKLRLSSVELRPEFQAYGQSRPALLNRLLNLREQGRRTSRDRQTQLEDQRKALGETKKGPPATPSPSHTTDSMAPPISSPSSGRKFKGVTSIFAKECSQGMRPGVAVNRPPTPPPTGRKSKKSKQFNWSRIPSQDPMTGDFTPYAQDDSADEDYNMEDGASVSYVREDIPYRKRKWAH
ncbi:MAG: hypothetical protein Q9165_004544 [Trypethelium subeluteriae]